MEKIVLLVSLMVIAAERTRLPLGLHNNEQSACCEVDPMNRNKKGAKKAPKNSKVSQPSQPQNRGIAHMYAPAAVSSSLRSYVKFSSGTRDGSLCASFRLPLCQIGNAGTTGNSYSGLLASSGGYTSSLGLHVDAVDSTNATFSYWQSPGVNLIAECFSRYQVRGGKGRFVYCPQSTSASTDRLVFAFSSDPDHPLIYNGGSALTTQTNLLGLAESIPFAPWNEWSMDVHLDGLQKYVASVASSSLDTTERRLTALGIFGCQGTSAQTTAAVYGVLYFECTVCFEDMNPLVVLTGTPTSVRRQKKMRSVEVLKEVVEDLDPPDLVRVSEPCSCCAASSSSSSCSRKP